MQKIRENSSKIKILLILSIILYICPSYTTAEIRTFSHDEEKDYGQTAIPHVIKTRVYDDGTLVARIIRINSNMSTTNKDCFYEMLSRYFK